MHLQSLYIENFKSFRNFRIDFSEGINILVGDNEAGKTTILEAINLALSGIYNSHYLKNELSQHLFNKDAVDEYLNSISDKSSTPLPLPSILIEVYFDEEGDSEFYGDYNALKGKYKGVALRVEFDENYQKAYQELLAEELLSLPIEFYKVSWSSFSRNYHLTSRQIPLKPLLIDSSQKQMDFSDSFISKVVKGIVDEKSLVNIAQAFRKSQDVFMNDDSLKGVNNQLLGDHNLSKKDIKLSVNYSSANAWENVLTTYLNDIPFAFIGKGEQNILKTRMCLARSLSDYSCVVMIEEPENHLSHSKLNEFIELIKQSCGDKQIIITTHSSFVANKLGLRNLILLANKKTIRLSALTNATTEYFEKLAGYDTLRMLLCRKAILVEGASDELVIQKAYHQQYGKLPIDDGVDVISVGNLSFLRFLEIAESLSLQVTVVTDNDGDIDALKRKYASYWKSDRIKICYDHDIRTGSLKIRQKDFNYNTMEPSIVSANRIEVMNSILSTNFSEREELHKYMKRNKTECALAIFKSDCENFNFPQYILDAIVK